MEEQKSNIEPTPRINQSSLNVNNSNNPAINSLQEPNDISNFVFEEIFTQDNIKEINEATAPKVLTCNMLEKYLNNKYGKVDIQSNLLMAQAEFYVNNLNFLQENYKHFPLEIICKLMNLLGILLKLNETEYSINLPKSAVGDEDEIKKYSQVPEPDFGYICNKKLNEFKCGLKFLKFIPTKREEMNVNPAFMTSEQTPYFYLDKDEVHTLLDYLQTFYFPFIRLYYHFINIDRITENKKLEVVINRPLPVPPLSMAVKQKLEKNIFEEPKKDEEKDNKEEEDEEEEEEEEKEDEKKKEGETYQDIMNRVTLNNETKKIVAERIEELHKDFDAKISERQRQLDNRVKEIAESVRPKKK